MMKTYKFYNLALIFFAIAALCLGLSGCADDSEDAVVECTDDFDCGFGESCDIPNGVCLPIGRQDPTTRPTLPECTSNAGCAHGQQCNLDTQKCEAAPASNNTPNPNNNTPGNNTPGACDPACPSGETCEEGVCVAPIDPNACDPVCESGYTCESGTCVSDDPNVCTPGCDISEHCDNGQCKPNASNPNDCSPACASNESCQAGSCVPNTPPDPDVCTPACPSGYSCQNNLCLPSNTGGCTPACPSGFTCEGTNICVPDSSGPGGQSCELWSTSQVCPSGELCNFASDTEGVCTDSIDPVPTSLGEECSPAYDMCGVYSDGYFSYPVACFPNQAGTSSCFMNCELGMGDCDQLGGFFDVYECVAVGYIPGAPSIGVCSRM